MTEAEVAAIEYTAMNNCTTNPRDRAVQALLVRSARNEEELRFIIRTVMYHRSRWLTYLTTTQRKWQKETRNRNKARHHDSISIREKYVRCSI